MAPTPEPDAGVPCFRERTWKVLVVSNDLKLVGRRDKDIAHGLKRDDPCDHLMGVGLVVTPRPLSTM